MTAPAAMSGDGKLIATPGTTQLEGSAGGGIVPWAMLAGYATREQWSSSAYYTHVNVDDLQVDAFGAALNFRDRVALSVARQSLEVAPLDTEIDMDIFGAKLRLYGDVVYSDWPQLSLGIQHKRLRDKDTPTAVGAGDTEGTDFYLAASKLHLGALAGYNVLWSVTGRYSRANQLGLLGFGGDRDDDRELLLEGSAAVLLSRRIAIGVEYRQKPDNLSFAKEEDWADVFVAWFPNKNLNVTLAWAQLGGVAGLGSQKGVYASITGYLQ